MSAAISSDFKDTVDFLAFGCLELGFQFPKLYFEDKEELEASAKYYFEHAAENIQMAGSFAKKAERIQNLAPSNSKKFKFRQALRWETLKQMRKMTGSLHSDCKVNADTAKGAHKFFGELFNERIIFADELLKQIQNLEGLITREPISHECLVILVQTVKAKIQNTPDDDTPIHLQLMEAILKPEYNQMPIINNQARNNSRTTESTSQR